MNRKLLRKVAKIHGVTVAEVRREIQAAIDEAYKNPTTQALSVTRKGDIPTPKELINHVAKKVKQG